MKTKLLMILCLNFLTSAIFAEEQSSQKGLIKHAVFFRYSDEVSSNPQKLAEIRQRFLALKRKSLKAGESYIISINAGNSNGYEGLEQGMTDGYILTFKSKKDRDYYVGCDQNIKCSDGGYKAAGLPYDKAHDEFKTFVGPLLYDADGDGVPVPEGVFVFDFMTE